MMASLEQAHDLGEVVASVSEQLHGEAERYLSPATLELAESLKAEECVCHS